MSNERDSLALAYAMSGPKNLGRAKAIMALVQEYAGHLDSFQQEVIHSVVRDMLAAAYLDAFHQAELIIDDWRLDAERYRWLRDGGIHRFWSSLSGDDLDEHVDDQLDAEERGDAE